MAQKSLDIAVDTQYIMKTQEFNDAIDEIRKLFQKLDTIMKTADTVKEFSQYELWAETVIKEVGEDTSLGAFNELDKIMNKTFKM